MAVAVAVGLRLRAVAVAEDVVVADELEVARVEYVGVRVVKADPAAEAAVPDAFAATAAEEVVGEATDVIVAEAEALVLLAPAVVLALAAGDCDATADATADTLPDTAAVRLGNGDSEAELLAVALP